MQPRSTAILLALSVFSGPLLHAAVLTTDTDALPPLTGASCRGAVCDPSQKSVARVASIPEAPRYEKVGELKHVVNVLPPADKHRVPVPRSTRAAETPIGKERSSSLTDFSPPLKASPICPELVVEAFIVRHPAKGAVYWESPVNIDFEVTLTGPGVHGLDTKDLHVCADIEESWPIRDWSRSCLRLDQVAAPGPPFLVFGSVIGAVRGTVSVWDARPACIPPGAKRGNILSMNAGSNEGLATRRLHFKIIHHESTLTRRGRPFGPAPLGRGFAATSNFLKDLEGDAEKEEGEAHAAMDTLLNGTYGSEIQIGGARCTSRLNVRERGSSLVTTGAQMRFAIEQLEWMITEGKLPEEMRVAAESMREVQNLLPSDSDDAFFKPRVLMDSWKHVAPFYQKALRLPAPPPARVVSRKPLYTWEYDEIPWLEALNPEVDWHAVEDAYLENDPVPLTYVDGFFSPKALAILLDLARGSTFFFDTRENYIGAYPSEGMSHPLLYQIAEEAAERLPRILGRNTKGWPLVQAWYYVYGGNNGETCTRGIKAHADTAAVNLNVWLAPDEANLGSAQTGDGGGLTIFHAKPPQEWSFEEFNQDPSHIVSYLEANDAGQTSVPHRQNRALLFDSMLFHQSDPFRFKSGFENRRINLTLLFGPRHVPSLAPDADNVEGGEAFWRAQELDLSASFTSPTIMREIPADEAGRLRYCL